jgi:branched-chain amino acid transport system substrate-binding protein
VKRLAALLGALMFLSGCGSDDAIPVYVSAPVSSEPWIANSIEQGARLAVGDINRKGGLTVDGQKRKLKLVVRDHGGSPANALADARKAVADHAAALLTDGTGATSVASITDPAHLPVFVCFEGGSGIIDPARRPSLFRMAPPDAILARRLADYIANDKPRVALLTDDTGYGAEGRRALLDAFTIDEVEVVSDRRIPRRAQDVAPQLLEARRADADILIVWASAAGVAAVVQGIHSANWDVPVISGQTGEDPLVRQRLVDHPDWLRSLRFASSRITAEVGPKPFEAFRAHFEREIGVQKVGVKQDGREVIQPPDWQMYPFDALNLVAEAISQGGKLGKPLLDLLNQVTIVGANGDSRGYNADYHEGISPADMYFATFDGFEFVPVTDDPLSGSLPKVPQLR